MTLPLLDLPDTVLRTLQCHLDLHSVLMLRQTSKMAAGSEVVQNDRMLAIRLALISGDECAFLRHVPKFRPADVSATLPPTGTELEALPVTGPLLFYRLARVLARMDPPRSRWAILRRWSRGHPALSFEHHAKLARYVAEHGAADSLDVLYAWKSRKGHLMYGVYQYPCARVVLAHPRIANRPDFVEWILQRMSFFLGNGTHPVHFVYSLPTLRATGYLKVLSRVFPALTEPATTAISGLEARSPLLKWQLRNHANKAMREGFSVAQMIFKGVGQSLEPELVFRAVLAALLLAQHNWHPGHVLARVTAIRLDFGIELTPEQGLAALRTMLVRYAGDDAVVADALVDGFAQIPPLAARNALLLFPRACKFPLEKSVDLAPLVAAFSIDPPEFSTLLEHELDFLWTKSDSPALSSIHGNSPLNPPYEYTCNPAMTVLNCRACRDALGERMTEEDVPSREWGLVVHVPAVLALG